MVGVRNEVVRHDRDLPAAAGGIDDVLGHGVPGRVAAQALDDLEALADRRPEVSGALDQVALVQVVRADPVLDQPWTSSRCVWTQSLTPARSTDWLPSGIPRGDSLSQARASSGVISLGWLTWMFSQSGWYLASISHSSSSMRWGMNTGTRDPIRTISTCGISRRPRSADSSSLGASVSRSPPEISTSRICGLLRMYSSWASCSCG